MNEREEGPPKPPTTTVDMTGASLLAARAAEPVLGLRIYGTNNARWYRDHEETITIGRLPTNMFPVEDTSVSKEHAKLVRLVGATWIEDRDSANGTFLDGQRLQKFQIAAGIIFAVGKVHLVAINDRTEALRLRFQRFLGYGPTFQVRVDDALYAATRRSHVVLYEPPGAGIEGLAGLIHETAPGPAWPMLTVDDDAGLEDEEQRALVRRGKMGTLVVRDSRWLRRAEHVRAALVKRTNNVRLIAVLPRKNKEAESILGPELRGQAIAIEVPSLEERGAVELAKVIEAIASEIGTTLGSTSPGLRGDDFDRLLARKWKHNCDEVDHVVRRVAFARMLGNNAAAARLGFKTAGGLSKWMQDHGFRE